MAQIIHIPKQFGNSMPPFALPVDDKDSVIRSQAATIAELQKAIKVLAHEPDPLVVQALRGDLAPDTCCACGCHISLKSLQTSYPLGVLYGDPHLAVTRALVQALDEECGPAVQELYEALGNDERLMVARQLSRVAVSAHLAEMAK